MSTCEKDKALAGGKPPIYDVQIETRRPWRRVKNLHLNLKPEIGGSPPATDLSFSDVVIHVGVLSIQIEKYENAVAGGEPPIPDL